MKIKLITLSLAFVLMVSQIILSPQEVSAAQPTVKLSSVKGEVVIKTGGGLHELPAVDGMELVQGDWLRTGKTGTAKLSYEDGTEATIGASSYLNIQRLTTSDNVKVSAHRQARITSWSDGHQSSISLWAGSIWSKVKSLVNIDDKYEVETPTAVMGVRGTLYLVSIDQKNGTTQSDVIDGSVGVTQNREGTQAAPVQLVTMGQTLRLVSLTEPLPDNKVINPQELIKNTQAEILVQLVNDIIERTNELATVTKEHQQAFALTGNIEDIKSAIGTSFKLDELASFSKGFMADLQKSDKLEEVKQVLKDNNMSIEQVQKTIDTIQTETEKTRTEVVKTAKDAGVSQEQIDRSSKEAAGVQTTPDSVPTPDPTPTPSPNGGGRDSSNTSSPEVPLGVPALITQNTPIIFTGGIKLDLGSLSIPASATVIANEVNPSDLPVGTTVAGKIVNFTFNGLTVDTPVSLTLPRNPTADPTKVGIFYLNGSVWEYQDSTVQNGAVVASVNHFSTYGVLEDTIPPTVSCMTEGTVTVGDLIDVTSNEGGFLYLIPSATSLTREAINASVAEGNGIKVAAKANVPAKLITAGLAAGDYKVYAIDAIGNVSNGWTITVNALNVRTCRINGVATLSDLAEQADYSGITITAKGFTEEGEAIEFAATTNNEGVFSLTQLPEGNYVLEASKTGYYTSSKLAKAVNGQTTLLEEIMILYPEVVSGTVKGCVRFIDKLDHQGIGVKVQTLEGKLLPDLIAMADSQGNFEFDELPVDKITNQSTYIFTAFALDDALGYATDSVQATVNANQITTVPETLWLRPAAEDVIIFADDPTPWDSEALQDMLNGLGVSYNIYASESMSSIPLPLNKTVWIINDQPQGYYDAYKANQSRFDEFVQQGGTLLFEACDMGWKRGSINRAGATLPGGVVNQLNYDNYNTNVNPSHPMMAGVPVDLVGDYASHNYFTNLPAVSTILCRDSSGNPTLVEYKYGQGRVVATGQPLEDCWWNNNLRQIYPNMIYYTFNRPVSSGLTAPFFVLSNGDSALKPVKSQNTLTYTAKVANDVYSLTVTPTASEGKVTVNGVEVTSGTASAPIDLRVGANTISVVVLEAAKMPKAYTITVTREAEAEAEARSGGEAITSSDEN
jgi:hypothetical protein